MNRVSPVIFWYRQSPSALLNMYYTNLGEIQESLPPETISGMVRVELDTSGHLLSLIAVPPQFQKNVAPAEQPDPAGLFAAAGLDFRNFQPTAPLWAAPVASNRRLAWGAPIPGYPDPLRVEAAWWDNKPVWFHVISLGPAAPDRRINEGLGFFRYLPASRSEFDSVDCLRSAGLAQSPAWPRRP